MTAQAGPRAEDLSRCVHCGLCLEACPTYSVLGLETESPRGRIQLARALVEDRIELTPRTISHFDLCLGCRACEPACPSGVPYGRIIEGVRNQLHERPNRPAAERLRTLIMRQSLAAPWRLKLGFNLLRFYQRTPLAALVSRFLPRPLKAMEAVLPRLSSRFFQPGEVAGEPAGSPAASVALLKGCVMPYVTPQTCEATVSVLVHNGRRVLTPSAQVCCGAMHVHNGDLEAARDLARRNIDTFSSLDIEAVIVNAGGCGSTLKEYDQLLSDDENYAARAQQFVARVRDVNEYLAAIPFEAPTGELPLKVTYQDSCHVVHAQRIREQPRQILRSIPGLELVEMENADRCCGSAGTYKLTQMEMSRTLLDDKLRAAAATGCSVIATANPDCMLQLSMGVRSEGSGREIVHVVELLDRAYQAEGK